jgi:hypothetical protein
MDTILYSMQDHFGSRMYYSPSPNVMSLSSLVPKLPKVTSSLSFLKDDPIYDEEKPYYCAGPLEPQQEMYRTNLTYFPTTIPFYDLRGFESQPDLEKNGFAFIRFPSEIAFDGNDNESVREYMLETTALLKEKLAAEKCYCYSYRVCLHYPAQLCSTEKCIVSPKQTALEGSRHPNRHAWVSG